MQNPIQELLQCAICLGQVSRPRVLPCLHSFCESCLNTHVQTTSSTSRRHHPRFHCPSCRVHTELPVNGVTGFPNDFHLGKFTDALKDVLSLKKEGVCDLCYTQDIIKSAKHFCADCQKYFCEECSVHHALTPVLNHHFVLDLRNEQRSGPKCRSHEKEPAKYVCGTCLHPVCVICVMGEHKFHSISHLNVSGSLQRTELHQNLGQLRQQIWSTQETLFHLTCLEGRLKSLYEESRLQIKKESRKRITKLLGDEGILLKDLDVIYDARTSEVFRLKQKCRDKLSSYESLQSQVGTVLKSDDINELMEKVPSLNEGIIKEKYSTDLVFTEDLLTFVQFKKGNCFRLGKLLEVELDHESRRIASRFQNQSFDSSDTETESHTHDETETNFVQSRNMMREEGEEGYSVLQPTPQSSHLEEDDPNTSGQIISSSALSFRPFEYNVSLISVFGSYGRSSGNICLPYSICFTQDNSLVVAENGNRRLQVFNLHGESLKTIGSGDIIPRSVTLTPDGKVAITDELTKTIKIFDFEGELDMTLDPAAATFPFGLATSNAGDLVFTDMIFENVTIMGTSGNLKCQFGSHGSLEDRFDNPGYVAVKGERIFVSDGSNHAIKVFDLKGRYCHKFGSYGTNDGQLRYPKAVCFDDDDHIFVADSGNNRIVLFSITGEFLSVVLDREMGLHRPTGIAYSSHGYLAVSMPDLNQVRIFRLRHDSRNHSPVRL